MMESAPLPLVWVAPENCSDSLMWALTDNTFASDGREQWVVTESDALRTRLETQHNAIHVIQADAFPPPSEYWSWLVRQLNHRMALAIVVRVGTELPQHALARLDSFSADTGAALFPLSSRHWLSRAFSSTREKPGLDVHDVDRWCHRYATNAVYDVPRMAGYTGWLNVAACAAENAPDDVALAEQLRRMGKPLRLTDAVYVDDSALQATEEHVDLSLPTAVREAFVSRHPLTGLRHPLSELEARHERPDASIPVALPVVLHISHSWGGGLARWIEDYAFGDADHTHWVLRSIGDWDAAGKSIALFRVGVEQGPVRQWTLTTPILSSATSHGEYQALLDEVLQHLPVTHIIVSTLIGHAMDVYCVSKPVIHVLHDFYPWCPPLYATWDTPCHTCDRSRLEQCLQSNPAHRFFQDEPVDWLNAMREGFVDKIIEHNVPLIVPSDSVKKRWMTLAPRLRDAALYVIGHGIDAQFAQQLSSQTTLPGDARRLRIVVIGSLAPHKGGELLEAALPDLTKMASLTLLGCGEECVPVTPRAGVAIVSSYRRDDLPTLLGEIKPHLALLLSIVPETFSYTLSELQAAHIPAIATRLGAFEDRIEDGVTGWLMPPTSEALVAQVAYLSAHPEDIESARAALKTQPVRTLQDMIADYGGVIPVGHVSLFRPRWGMAPELLSLKKRIYVPPDMRYRDAMADFLRVTEARVGHSPRLGSMAKKCVLALLATVRQWLEKR